MMGSGPHPFGPADFRTWSDYASLDEQLARYFKKPATGIIVPLLFSFLPLTLCNGTKAGIAFSVFAAFSFLFTVVPLLFAGKMPPQPGDSGNNRQHRQRNNQTPDVVSSLKKLCFAAYVSNILLMLTAVCLASVVNNKYFALASPLLLIVFVLLVIFIECGRRNGFIWGALKYKIHQSDLKFFFDLSSEVAQTAVMGLSGSLLWNMKRARRLQGDFRIVEGCILYAGVMSLFLMLFCTIPPAIILPTTRQRVADKFLKWAANFSLALISLAELFVVADVVQAYAVFAAALIAAVGAFWFCMVYRSEPSASLPHRSPQAEARHVAGERSFTWLGIHSVMFGMMMASYSAFPSGQHLSALYKAWVFFIFAAHLTNFSRMVLVRESQDRAVEASVVLVLEISMVVFILLVVLLLILLAKLQLNQLRSTFGVEC